MREVIEVNSGYRIILQIFYHRYLGNMTHFIILIPEFQWNESVEPSCSILQIAQALHMIYAMLVGFNVTVKNGRIAVHPQFMSSLVNFKPGVRIAFILTDFGPYGSVENFRSSTGQRIQTGLFQIGQSITDGHLSLANHVL